MLARCLTVERPMRDSSPSSTHSTISGALRSRRARNTFSATLCRDVSSDTWWETPSLRSNHVTLKYLSRDNRTARNVLSRWTRTLSWFESRSANSSSSSWWLRRNRRSPSVAHTFTPSAAKHGRVPNKKQCSRQLQCKVPCGVGNVNSALFINSSLSSLSSTSHAGPSPQTPLGEPPGGSGTGGGLGDGGLEGGAGGRGHFIHPAIYCTATWCFALKGLRTMIEEITKRSRKFSTESASYVLFNLNIGIVLDQRHKCTTEPKICTKSWSTESVARLFHAMPACRAFVQLAQSTFQCNNKIFHQLSLNVPYHICTFVLNVGCSVFSFVMTRWPSLQPSSHLFRNPVADVWVQSLIQRSSSVVYSVPARRSCLAFKVLPGVHCDCPQVC